MRRNFLLMTAFITYLMLTSCSKAPEHSTEKEKKILSTVFHCDPSTLDPRKGGDIISSAAQFMLFEGLTAHTPASSSTKALAETIEISPDLMTYTFHLRKSFWSDGQPLTSHDFLFAWLSILDPTFPSINPHLLYSIKNAEKARLGLCPLSEVGVECLDASTLKVTLEQPTLNFLETTSFAVLFPVPSHIVKEHPDWNVPGSGYFVSNGPFCLKEWNPSDRIIFEKNPLYWNKQSVQLDEITCLICKDAITSLELFEKEKLDLIVSTFCPLPQDALTSLKKSGKLKSTDLGGSHFCTFNTQNFPFNNLNIRKALSAAIDRKQITEHIAQLGEEVALEIIHPLFKEGKKESLYENANIELAKKYLEEGLKECNLNELTFTLTYTKDAKEEQVAQTLQQRWKETLGVEVHLQSYEFKTYQQTLMNKQFSVALAFWAPQIKDALTLLERLKNRNNKYNYSCWENQEYKEVLKQAYNATSPQEKKSLLQQAERIIVKDLPITCLYHRKSHRLEQPYVKNLFVSSIGSLRFHEVDIVKKETPLRVNLTQNMLTLDPRKGAEFTSCSIQSLLFEGLVRHGKTSSWEPCMAEKIDVSEDGLTYTFHVKKAFWSHGEKVTAKQFADSWKSMLDPKFPAPNTHLFSCIKNADLVKQGKLPLDLLGIEAIDEKTLVVRLEQKTPYFLELLCFCSFYPVYDPAKDPTSFQSEPEKIPCNGPFCIQKWELGKELILEKNPLYHEQDKISLSHIHCSFIQDVHTAIHLFEKGQLDIIGSPFTQIDPEQISILTKKHSSYTTPLAASTFYAFNLQDPLLKNLHFRKALALAIDRKQIIESLPSLSSSIGEAIIPPALMHAKTPLVTIDDGNASLAKKHLSIALEELKLEPSKIPALTILSSNVGYFTKLAQIIQQQWKETLGIESHIECCEYKVFTDKLLRKDFQVGQAIWIAQFDDPINILERFKYKNQGKNYPGFEDEAFIHLLEASYLTSLDQERELLFKEAEKILMDQCPLTVLYHWENQFIYNKNVKLPTPGYDGVFSFSDISLKED